jgi:hypothetical protein
VLLLFVLMQAQQAPDWRDEVVNIVVQMYTGREVAGKHGSRRVKGHLLSAGMCGWVIKVPVW